MPGPCGVCRRPSTRVCGGCKLTNYCGREHQRLHWRREHKNLCKPLFRIEESERLGRHMVAARDITRGELIMQEPPLVVGPKAFSTPVCLGCHAACDPGDFAECDGCGFPMCSVECQTSESHVDECRIMSDRGYRARIEGGGRNASYFPIVPLRCLLTRDKNPEKYGKIMNLQSNLEERANGSVFELYRRNVARFLLERLRMTQFDEAAILTVAGILDTNAFEVGAGNVKLRGLYNAASMLAHNCKPNTRHVFYGPDFTIGIIATRDIPAGDCIFATYTQTLWGTLSRRMHLKSAKCFDCTCERCSDPTELGTYIGAIRCVRCATPENPTGGPYITSTDPLDNDAPWECENCRRSIAGRQILSGNENLREEISRLGKKTAPDLERFIEKYGVHGGGVLHPGNSYVVQVKHALVQIYGNLSGYGFSELSDDDLNRKIGYCRELLGVVDVLEPGYSKIRGELLNELQAAMAVQAKRNYNQRKITKEAAQKTLLDSMAMLSEVAEILKLEPDTGQLRQRLEALDKELDD